MDVPPPWCAARCSDSSRVPLPEWALERAATRIMQLSHPPGAEHMRGIMLNAVQVTPDSDCIIPLGCAVAGIGWKKHVCTCRESTRSFREISRPKCRLRRCLTWTRSRSWLATCLPVRPCSRNAPLIAFQCTDTAAYALTHAPTHTHPRTRTGRTTREASAFASLQSRIGARDQEGGIDIARTPRGCKCGNRSRTMRPTAANKIPGNSSYRESGRLLRFVTGFGSINVVTLALRPFEIDSL